MAVLKQIHRQVERPILVLNQDLFPKESLPEGGLRLHLGGDAVRAQNLDGGCDDFVWDRRHKLL